MASHSSPYGGVSRRRFVSGVLGAAAAGSLSIAWPVAHAGTRDAASAGVRRAATFGAFLDTLLPRDELSGSASDLGIPRQMLMESRGDPQYARLIRLGCRWLDLAAEGSFAEAAPRVREVIVEWMTTSDWDEVPRRFYALVRQRAVTLYYSRSEGWRGLPVTQPPQPVGHPAPWA